MSHKQTKKLGLALSGASARSSFYVGFLEVLAEEGVEIECISAQSGATIVASCFACDTLDKFKKDIFSWGRQEIFDLFLGKSRGQGGLYSLDKVAEYGRKEWSHGKRLEEVRPRLSFIATDLNTGEVVGLEMGDIAQCVVYSCTVPGVFTPQKWGNRVLVDGGLVSFIPGEFARKAGAEVVVGVNVRATKHIFPKFWLGARTWYNWVRRVLAVNYILGAWHGVFRLVREGPLADYFDSIPAKDSVYIPGSFGVVGRAMDIAIEASKKAEQGDGKYGCDLVITAGVGDFGGSVRISDMKNWYEQGRAEAKKTLPKIWELVS